MTTNEILKKIIGNGNKTHFATKHGLSRKVLGFWLSDSRNIKISTLENIAKKEGYRVILTIEKLC